MMFKQYFLASNLQKANYSTIDAYFSCKTSGVSKHKERPMKDIIGRRIKDERNRQKLTQDELIRKAHLEWDRQTLGQIENGERELKAWELAKISSVLRLDMGSFFPSAPETATQPLVLWRQQPENHEQLEAEFIRLCKDYKFVEELNAIDPDGFRKLPHKEIDLSTFRYSDAYALAEEIRDELGLGDYPATSIVKTLEEKYGVKFFFDGLDGAPAASSVSDYGLCIVVSSTDPAWRQHFSIAHELFHIITWSDRILERVLSDRTAWDRNEKLANAFAAGLLVPSEPLRREIRSLAREGKLSEATIVAIAQQFGVSLEALLWRMANQRVIPPESVNKALADDTLRALDREHRAETRKSVYVSNRFIRLAYLAYENGEISRGRLAKILKQPLSALTSHLKQVGLAEVSNNEIALSYI